ncbi:MAG TPA: hypothetical protein VFN02_01695 [Ktedonobacteraceae bacterium]|nr:hypothetical protein [Ktedonobacteraceae bacterium]
MSRRFDDGKTQRRAGAEFLLFLIASAVGVYSLGQGLSGLFEPGQGINLLWLAVTGVAMIILFAQMGRVQDSWPRRRSGESQQITKEAAQELPVQSEER